MKTIKQILNDAADLIEGEGKWTQGVLAKFEPAPPGVAYGADYSMGDMVRSKNMGKTPSCMCAIGAITWAVINDPEPVPEGARWVIWYGSRATTAENAFSDYLGTDVVAYNDDETTTQEDVVASLRECAKGLP